MTALADKRTVRAVSYAELELTLKSGKVGYQGGMACLNTADGKVYPGVNNIATLIPIGHFKESCDASLADTACKVRLFREVKAAWWVNGGNVSSANLMHECYIEDDQTVTMTSTSRSKAGRVIAVDSAKGVLVEAGLAVTGPTGAQGPTGPTGPTGP